MSRPGAALAPDRGDVVLALIRCLAALGLVVASVWLPWATFKASELGISLNVTPGSESVALCVIGLVVIGLSLVQLVKPAQILGWLLLALSALALLLAIVAALRSKADGRGNSACSVAAMRCNCGSSAAAVPRPTMIASMRPRR